MVTSLSVVTSGCTVTSRLAAREAWRKWKRRTGSRNCMMGNQYISNRHLDREREREKMRKAKKKERKKRCGYLARREIKITDQINK